MERARETWTDERLDDLARRVEGGFDRVDSELRAMRVDLNARFDGLQRTILQVGGGLIAAFLAGFATPL